MSYLKSILCLSILCLSILVLISSSLVAAEGRDTVRERIRDRIQQHTGSSAPQKQSVSGNQLHYPRSNLSSTVRLGEVEYSVWQPSDARVSPLIIFSHGYRGCSTQSTFLTKALADRGYLVFAPNHRDAMCKGKSDGSKPEFGKPESWSDKSFRDRRDDIVELINNLRSSPEWAQKIDWAHVGLAGHSLGGYTVVGIAGGWNSWRIPGISAVLAMSPYVAPYLKSGTLRAIQVPLFYQGGTRDIGITPSLKRRGGAFESTPSPTYFIEFEGAGHFAWTDMQPQFHQEIIEEAAWFFGKYLRSIDAKPPSSGLRMR